MNVDAVRVAADDLILDDRHLVLRTGLDHNSTRFEMLKLTVLNVDVGVDADQASCACVVRGVTLKFAVDHLDAGAFKSSDTRHLAVRFSEYSTIEQDIAN